MFFLCGILLAQEKNRIDFNHDWKFILDSEEAIDPPDINEKQWKNLTLPHDWSIDFEFDKSSPSGARGAALRGGTGWYKNQFKLNKNDKNKNVFLDFEGVYMNSTVWIKGTKLGTRPYGYISFRYDITPYLNHNKTPNIILVKVENKQPNSRWYSGSGIYRNVWLIKKHKIQIAHWGTFIQTPQVGHNKASIAISTKLNNTSSKQQSIILKTTILNEKHKVIATMLEKASINANSSSTLLQNISLIKPNLWDIKNPYLYTALSEIIVNGKNTDTYKSSFGIRKFRFDVQEGFFLNDVPTKLIGVCMHHDLGALGSAFNYRAAQRQLEILKNMGINGLRTSHNPPAPELLNLCDKMGFIVMDETFDVWKEVKENTPYNYNLYFDTWSKKDITDHITRDRNHPSVMIWSIGNEIPEQNGSDTIGRQICRDLVAAIKTIDTTRPVTSGLNGLNLQNHFVVSGALDIIGINYDLKKYPFLLNQYPNKKFILSETISALQTRSSYDMPSDSIRRWAFGDNYQGQGNAKINCSAYDNCSAPWGSTHEETLKLLLKYKYLSGMFVWTGFDYLGEPTPYSWPARSSYFGIVDLAGFPKDVYYLYQSLFTNKPVLHIFPHWNWQKGDSIDVWVYYNKADEVELFLNKKSLGTKKKNNDEMHVQWRVNFEPGTLKAVANKNGKKILEKKIYSSDIPTKIILSVDRNVIKANAKDLAFVKVSIVDNKSHLVPTANNKLHFTISGNGFIRALDNGSQTDTTSFANKQNRNAFNGLALAIVQATKQKGQIILTAKAKELQTASIKIITQ